VRWCALGSLEVWIFYIRPLPGRRRPPPQFGWLLVQQSRKPFDAEFRPDQHDEHKKISHKDFEQAVFVRESLSTKNETIKVCHTLLQRPQFFELLVQIDTELAAQMHASACQCGGVLHRANYPRKPKACPEEIYHAFESRWSFCCNLCRKRSTPMSVRFLGRRVYVALAVVVLAVRRNKTNAAIAQLAETLQVPERTIARWRQWWLHAFGATALWQAQCARFMPSVETTELPQSLMARFTGAAHEAMGRLLMFLSPLSVRI